MAGLIENKKVRFNYEIVESFEAGIELTGSEVKSVRAGRGVIDSAFVIIRGGEAFLMNSEISAYQPKNAPESYELARIRKLLLTKTEIKKLQDIEGKKGLTIVPISLYNKGAKIKAQIAVVRGKKKFDKRETIKKRESSREMERTLKNR